MQELANRFTYKDGWLYKKSNGNKCTLTNNHGYIRVSWDKGAAGRVREYAHRLIWFMHYGEIPDGMSVDHTDMDKTNNRIENLRLIHHAGNMQNKRCKGYHIEKRSGLYRAEIKLHGKSKQIGLFSNATDARNAYLKAKRVLHKHASEGALTF